MFNDFLLNHTFTFLQPQTPLKLWDAESFAANTLQCKILKNRHGQRVYRFEMAPKPFPDVDYFLDEYGDE